ncbi:MAG: hypothetical protein ACE5GF_09025, partial [Thermodesulfobacteriota bacterium]
MKAVIEKIQKKVTEGSELIPTRGKSRQKLLLILLVTLIISALFLTTYSAREPSYEVGDIAVMDVKSPSDISVNGTRIKRGEIVVREGGRITAEGLAKIQAIQELSHYNRPYLLVPGLFLLTVLLFAT